MIRGHSFSLARPGRCSFRRSAAIGHWSSVMAHWKSLMAHLKLEILRNATRNMSYHFVTFPKLLRNVTNKCYERGRNGALTKLHYTDRVLKPGCRGGAFVTFQKWPP